MKTVLLIEDDPSLRWLLYRILGKHYHVKLAGNGLEAWYWLSGGNNADLIIMDLAMPEMSGLELLENLKTSGIYKDIPVVILTGNDDLSSKQRAIDLGAIAYLTKPFEPVTLTRMLGETITTYSIGYV